MRPWLNSIQMPTRLSVESAPYTVTTFGSQVRGRDKHGLLERRVGWQLSR